MCWIRLHSFLLNTSSLTSPPGGGITTLVFMVKMLVRLNGCSFLTSPTVSKVNGQEFNIALVSTNCVLKDSSLKLLSCATNNEIRLFRAV